MISDVQSWQDARVLLSLARLRGVKNRRALELFNSAAERRDNSSTREVFLSLAGECAGGSAMQERAWEESGHALQRTHEAGIQVVTFISSDYPERLRRINDPPVVLFVKGEISALRASDSIAIVGTREPTRCGEQAAEAAGRLAAEAGIAVVSGLALGCDTKAHQGCVDADGIGVAVLANGLDRVYPAANRDLANQILDRGGCLVSESPVGSKLTRWAFAYRDRIQSGLSDRVLVIETDVKGGTMHTVRFSKRQQRQLGCINHRERFLSEKKTRGNQMLIREGTAVGISDSEELGRFVRGIPFAFGSRSSDGRALRRVPSVEERIEANASSETTAELMSDSTPVTRAMPRPTFGPDLTEAPRPVRPPTLADMPTRIRNPQPEVEQLTLFPEDR